MTKPIHILNGPNLNLLGTREPGIYGRETLNDIKARCEAEVAGLGLGCVFRQSNHEGVLVEWIHEARADASALLINPAAYGHTSVALHDALKALDLPIIEIHLSQPLARESFRHHSYVSLVADGVISGFGALGYVLGIKAAAEIIANGAA
ncbi:type II 3-dehydroquinate dehydratase [Marinicauda sp. Alg238-R41]|uniref:type II 3-dehydroquinate dehydratase n=1 Tax=Marinicauda sp. Alg238-R41 TaxID=2993447 RepID=UPI0022E8C6B2|nr:type II 3-dehydroquinate dehydratase [Marinicauda sp. Alg238-R41]